VLVNSRDFPIFWRINPSLAKAEYNEWLPDADLFKWLRNDLCMLINFSFIRLFSSAQTQICGRLGFSVIVPSQS